MIAVQLNKRDFEYDIHSLIRAFYPGMEVSVYCQGEEEPEWDWKIEVSYLDREIRAAFLQGDGQEFMGRSAAIQENTDRAEKKNVLKRLLYEMLSGYTGQELPWGTLTGIRPTKIPMALLEEGKKNAEIAQYMRSAYYCSR